MIFEGLIFLVIVVSLCTVGLVPLASHVRYYLTVSDKVLSLSFDTNKDKHFTDSSISTDDKLIKYR